MGCSLPQRCAQMGVSRPVSPRAVRRVDQAVRLSLALCADGVLVRFCSPPRCAQVGVSVMSHPAQCAGWIRRCGFPSRCARMGCWSVFALHRAVRRWECPSCLTPRSAQGGSGGAAFPRAVRGWGVGPFLFFPPPRCAQVGVSVRSHRCAVRRVDQAWSADAPKKRSDAFANTLKVSGGHERGATCARSADAPKKRKGRGVTGEITHRNARALSQTLRVRVVRCAV